MTTEVAEATPKEKTNAILNELIEHALSGIDAAIEFSQAHIPDLIEQLLMWNLVESLLQTALGVVILVASVYVAYRILSIQPELVSSKIDRWGDTKTVYRSTFWHDSDGDATGHKAAIVFTIFPAFFGVCFINLDWLKILVAPKLYLLEYSAALIK